MRPSRRGLSASTCLGTAAAAALVLALASAAIAQTDDEEVRRHGIFLDTLDVSLINVEVVATRDGRPVTDLTPEDFEILDDGEPVEMTNFYRVEGGRRVPAAGGGDGEEPEAGTVAAGAQQRAFVVVLVDHAFISPASRAKVFHELRERLDQLMADGTQVMVLSKRRQIELVQRPTSDRSEVEAALDRLGKVATANYITDVRRKITEIEQGKWLPDIGLSVGDPIGPDTDDFEVRGDAFNTYGLVRNHSQETYIEVRRTVQELRRILGSLAGLPGKKAVLYVADRLPLKPGEELWYVWFEKYGIDYGNQLGVSSVDSAVREFDTTDEIRDLIADATASRIAFYPVGAGPTSGIQANSAEYRTTSITGGFLTQIGDIESGLGMLAGSTGGQAAFGGANPGWLFDRLHQDLTNYYSLAYPSPHRGDGDRHRIEVRVRREGVQLDYLESYRDKSGDQEMNERTMASLLLEATENPLEVKVLPGETERQKNGKYLMKMQVRFPISKLVLLPQEKSHVGRVSIVFLVRDERGRLSDPVKVLVPIEVPHEGLVEALSQTAVYATELAMRGGEQRIAIGVRDDLGSTSSTVSVNVHVGGSRG